MKNTVAFMFLLLFSACSKKSEFKRGPQGSIFINPKGHGVKKVRVIDWKVGKTFKEEVSKGVSVSLTFPQLQEDHLRELYNDRRADSFLVRISRKSLYGTRIVDYAHVPFLQDKKGDMRFYQPKGITVNIYYAAAAVSKRFENFYCPAFGHNKVVKDYEVNELAGNVSDQIVVSSIEESKVTAKISDFTYAPYIVNGGASLVGEFVFEVAFFSRVSKLKKSNFITLPNTVVIESEGEKRLKGCDGFVIPKKPENKGPGFRWGGK